jgi:hypothetical protein
LAQAERARIINRDEMMRLKCSVAIAILLGLTGCSDNLDTDGSQQPAIENPKVVNFSFEDATTNWEAGFADYPVTGNEFYELRYEYMQLPEPLEDESGLLISGNNHSDDLFMYVTKKFTGFQPSSRYELEFEVVLATNEPSGCFGIGGAPGESVYVKAGATTYKPESENLGTGNFSMNLDKGNQSSSGSNAFTIGNIANGLPCVPARQYVMKSLNSDGQSFELLTDPDGILWLMFGTDSGFEGTTSIYYLSGKLTATLVN